MGCSNCSKNMKFEFKDTIFFDSVPNILEENEKKINEMASQDDNNCNWKNCYLVNKEDKNENINYNVKYNMLNKINYPINFNIIIEDFYSKLEKGMNNTKSRFLILFFKGYIIIKSNEKNNIYYICSLKDRFHFEVDFIFVFFICQNYNNSKKINEIIENKDLKNEQNDNLIYLQGEYEDKIGFYFKCNNDINPSLKAIINIDDKIENSKLLNIYDGFLNSINSMESITLENITTDEIEKIISQNSNSLFLFDFRIIEKFLKGISEKNYLDGDFDTNNNKGESFNVDNNYSLYLLSNIILNFKELNKKEHISLITENMFLPDKIKDIKDKLAYLLLINNKYYLYLKSEKKILGIKKSKDSNKDNIWDIMQNDSINFNNDIINIYDNNIIKSNNNINNIHDNNDNNDNNNNNNFAIENNNDSNFINNGNINDNGDNVIKNNNNINDFNDNNFDIKNNNDNNFTNNDNINDNGNNNNFSDNITDNNDNNNNNISNNNNENNNDINSGIDNGIKNDINNAININNNSDINNGINNDIKNDINNNNSSINNDINNGINNNIKNDINNNNNNSINNDINNNNSGINNDNNNFNNDNNKNNIISPNEENNNQFSNEFNYDNLNLENIDNNSGNQFIPSSIIQKLVKLYYNDIYYKIKIDKKEIEQNEYEIKLINKEWLNKYKEFYKYSEVTENLRSIDMYSDIWNNLPTIKKEIIQDSKFPNDLKISQKISPIMSQNGSLLEYPTNFEVIQDELFASLLKEEDDFDNYEIQNDNDSFNCLLGNNHIFIYNKNSPNLLIFNFDKNENIYKIKYAFTYSNNYILNNEIKEIMKLKYLENYLFNKDLNIDSNKDKSFKEGTFYNFNQEKLGISRFTKPPLIGLANIGATCYMNATLQCLSNIDALTNYFLIYQNVFSQNVIKYDLTNEYAKLVKNLWDENNVKKYYEPYDFKNKIGQKNPLFSGIAANDSKDLILFIFQEMHKELNNFNMSNINLNEMNNQIDDQRNEKGEYKKFFDDYYSANNSIIQNLFYGEQESFSICHNCNVKLYNFNVFSFLIFPLEKVRQYMLNIQTDGLDKVTLKDCFEQYTSEEILSGENQMYCNYCHQNADYSTYNKIYKHPEILVIILNRGNGLEFNVEFEYPKIIKINEYINFDNNSNYDDEEDINYELIGLISHLGDSSMSGHFIAICKNPVDKKWYKFNDAIVSESSSELVSDDNLNNIPYVLFYKIISSNIPKENQIILYFDFSNEKELYLNLDKNTIFSEVINLLIEEYKLPQENYKCFKGFIEIDKSKSIKDNLLNDGDHVKIEAEEDDFELI